MTPEDFLKEGERLDDLQRSSLKLIQDPGRFCFGMDAVLLSGFATVKKGDLVTDLCTGTGIIPVLLTAKTGGRHFTGIEIQEEEASLAERNVRLNGLSDRVSIIRGDIRDPAVLPAAGSMDAVTCNPPYIALQKGIQNPDGPKAVARHELTCTMDDAVKAAARLLREGGRLSMVHRPGRLAELISCMRSHGLEPKRLKTVHAYADREAVLVLVEAAKSGGSFLKVEAPLILYDENGRYTEEVRTVYGY